MAEETPMGPFNLEKVYDEEIFPLMAKIIEVCKRAQMPMLASFCYAKGQQADDPDGVDYCTTAIRRDGWTTPELEESLGLLRRTCRNPLIAITITPAKPGQPLPGRD